MARRWWFRAGLFIAFTAMPALLRAEPLSIPEFNVKLAQWQAGRKEPPQVVFDVEGRAAPLGPRTLKFKHCGILFESEADLPQFTRRNSNVQVQGLVVRSAEKGSYTFHIQKIHERPTDLERYLEVRRELRNQPAAEWHALGEWARARGEFYKDDELLARSDEAHQRGLDLERKALADDNPQALFDLAARARGYRLPAGVSQELAHEAAWRWWHNDRNLSGPPLEALLSAIAERLPGAAEPASDIPLELQEQYQKVALETYRTADAATRLKLHRLLYAEVLVHKLASELAPDAANGFVVAEEIDKRLPERHALAETYRDRALAARAREIENLTRPEIVALAEQYRGRDQPALASQVVESWLTLRRRRLEPDDSEGLLQLTEDYRTLLKRDDTADRLLMDAWRTNPKANDVAERLSKAGYRRQGETWVTEREYRTHPEGQIEKAIREGRVEPGMTADQVRRSLGEPQTIARTATSGQVVDVWIYEQSGTTRLLICLHKNRRQAELTVVDVSQEASP